MADGSTTFLSDAISFDAGNVANVSQNDASAIATALVKVNDPARGVLQKLSNRSDGNPVSIPE